MEFWEEIKLKSERRELLHWFGANEMVYGTPGYAEYKAKALRLKRINQRLGRC